MAEAPQSPSSDTVPILTDEAARVRALREYATQDSPPTPYFKDILDLASQVSGASMTMLTMVDADRMRFMPRHGSSWVETSRAGTFCSYGIQTRNGCFVVPDATKDERFCEIPVVTGESHIRFYAGAPLIAPNGFHIGMLCVLDQAPHTLSGEQENALCMLSRLAMGRLELQRQLTSKSPDWISRSAAESTLHRRESILEAINFSVESLLNAEDYEAVVAVTMQRMARATGSDQLSIWTYDSTSPESPRLCLRRIWSDPALTPPPAEALQPVAWKPANGWRSAEILLDNRTVQGGAEDCTAVERKFLRGLGVGSFLWLPISTGPTKFWGILSLGCAQPGVRWSQPEVEALRSASRVLGSFYNQHAMEEALRKSEARLRTLSASAPIGIFETDATARINLYSNSRLQAIFMLTEEEIRSGLWTTVIHPDDRKEVEAAWAEAIRNRTTMFVEHRIVRPPNWLRWVKTLASPMLDSAGNITSFVGTVDDVTEAYLTTEALSLSESKYRSLVVSLKEVVFQTNEVGLYTFLNPSWTEITGFSVKESLNTLFLDYVHPDDRELNSHAFLPLVERKKEYCRHEVRFLTKSGDYRWVEVFARLTTGENDNVVGISGTLADVTERKTAAESIQRSLHEKEILLKEIHHRVKNNMQVISSLLSLQSDNIGDERIKSLFLESQSRIASMALIHEKLYQSSDLGHIDFADYLQGLVENLTSSLGAGARTIDINLDVPLIFLGIDTAIPCGLIINELISNAFKHAFHAGSPGRIEASLTRVENGRLRLVVRDNGCGIPPGIDPLRTKSLGLKLVHTLTRQLRGEISIENDSGTCFVLLLREVPAKESPHS